MQKILLGNTGIQIEGTGFGALPIHRRTLPEAMENLQAAYAGGIRFYDTARAYSDSEEKLGCAFRDVRKDVIIATKTGASTVEEMKRHLEETLRCLQTDYVDIYQLHNPSQVPDADSPLYRQLAAWKAQGVIRHIGLTNHSADNAIAAAQSGLYEVIQFPLSCISAPRDLEVIAACQAHGVGILAMKALAGGLITDASLSYAFLSQYPVVPLWGVQYRHELDNILQLMADPPRLTEAVWEKINALRQELSEDFCRGCGYCLPCPAGIPINNAARMTLLMGRSPWQPYVTPQWQEQMARIENCQHCGACASRCPYHLDTPALLQRNYAQYKQFLKEHHIV